MNKELLERAGIDPEEWRRAGEQDKRREALKGFNQEGWARLRDASIELPLSKELRLKMSQTRHEIFGKPDQEAYLDLQKEAGEIMANDYLQSNLIIPKEARIKDKQLLPQEQWRENALGLLPDKGEAIKQRQEKVKELGMELIRLAQRLSPKDSPQSHGLRLLISFAETLFRGEMDPRFTTAADVLLEGFDADGQKEILMLFGKIQGLYYGSAEGLKDKNQDWANYWSAVGYKWEHDGMSCERKAKPEEKSDRSWIEVY